MYVIRTAFEGEGEYNICHIYNIGGGEGENNIGTASEREGGNNKCSLHLSFCHEILFIFCHLAFGRLRFDRGEFP